MYILSLNPNNVQNYHLGGRNGENSSNHVKVACGMLVTPPVEHSLPQTKSSLTIKKLQWDKTNRVLYENILEMELENVKLKVTRKTQ